jgi:hypothetical protein
VGVAATLITACSNDSKAGPTATVPAGTPTTAATDPYAVPEVIDEAYVNRVLAGLDQAVGDVTRLVVETKTIPPEAVERLKTLYTGEFLQLQLDAFQQVMRDDFVGFRDPIGNQKTSVTELITARSDCVFAEVFRDYSAVGTSADPALGRLWIGLRPLNLGENIQQYNPTPWRFVYDGSPEDLAQPADPCQSS